MKFSSHYEREDKNGDQHGQREDITSQVRGVTLRQYRVLSVELPLEVIRNAKSMPLLLVEVLGRALLLSCSKHFDFNSSGKAKNNQKRQRLTRRRNVLRRLLLVESLGLLQLFVDLTAGSVLEDEVDLGGVVEVAVHSENIRMPMYRGTKQEDWI